MEVIFEGTIVMGKNAFCTSGEIPKECTEGSRDSTDSKEFVDPQCQPSTNVDPMEVEGLSSSRARPVVNKGKSLSSLKAQETTRVIVNFFIFFSKIMCAALALSAFLFATCSLSNAMSVKACACFNYSLATSTICSNRLNLAITIGVVAAPCVQKILVSNHLKNLHARSSSCTIKYST